jgi:hypothetical protein
MVKQPVVRVQPVKPAHRMSKAERIKIRSERMAARSARIIARAARIAARNSVFERQRQMATQQNKPQ